MITLHLVVNVVHATAHTRLHIDMNLWQTVFILVVIIVLPLVAGFLLWRRSNGGFLLLLVSMLGALLFGGYYHFIAKGADNVATQGFHSWVRPFQITAVLLALIEAAGASTGLAGIFRKEMTDEK
jgi:hypothetical protein